MNVIKKLYALLAGYFTKLQLLAILAIAVYVFLLSESNIFARWQYDSDIRELNSQIEYYKQQSESDQQKLKELEADKDQIEKFARENYLMKKSNEDIYIIK